MPDVQDLNRQERRLHPHDLQVQVLVLLDLPQGLEGPHQLWGLQLDPEGRPRKKTNIGAEEKEIERRRVLSSVLRGQERS